MTDQFSGPAVSLLIVARHSDSILSFHARLAAQVDKLAVDHEFIYLVRSTDARASLEVRELCEQDPTRVRALFFGHALGEAALLSAAISHAAGAVFFLLRSELEVEADVLSALHREIAAGADLAFASRKPKRVSARVHSRVFNRLVSWAAGVRFTDVASTARAVRREVAKELPIYGDFHRYLPILADRLGFDVREVPTTERVDLQRPWLHGPGTYLWRAIDILSIFFLTRFTRLPLRLFGGVGSAFGAVGAGIILILGVQRMLGTPLADRPLLVLGVLLLGLGVQAFTIGLLGELILFFHARSIRDYRIAAVHEAPTPALPEPARSAMARSAPERAQAAPEDARTRPRSDVDRSD